MAEVESLGSAGGPGRDEQFGVLIARKMVERTLRQAYLKGYVNTQTMRQIMNQAGMGTESFRLGMTWLISGHHVNRHPFDKDAYTLSSTGMRLGGA